ncbi:MAG: hypothetical protein AAF193_07435 [Bacteroidota bacterium]
MFLKHIFLTPFFPKKTLPTSVSFTPPNVWMMMCFVWLMFSLVYGWKKSFIIPNQGTFEATVPMAFGLGAILGQSTIALCIFFLCKRTNWANINHREAFGLVFSTSLPSLFLLIFENSNSWYWFLYFGVVAWKWVLLAILIKHRHAVPFSRTMIIAGVSAVLAVLFTAHFAGFRI